MFLGVEMIKRSDDLLDFKVSVQSIYPRFYFDPIHVVVDQMFIHGINLYIE